MMELLAVALGGGFGAAARYGVDQLVPKPWGTLVINMAGSFALGLIVAILFNDGALAASAVSYHLLGTGFCGGFTTFSTASLEAVKIGRTDDLLNGGTYTMLMLAASVLSAALGMAIGTVLTP